MSGDKDRNRPDEKHPGNTPGPDNRKSEHEDANQPQEKGRFDHRNQGQQGEDRPPPKNRN